MRERGKEVYTTGEGDGRKEGGREVHREGVRDGERERGREGGSERGGGREGERGRQGGREGGKEGGSEVNQGVYLTLHRTAVCMYVQCYCMQAILMEGRRCSSEDFPSSQQYVHCHIQTIPQRVLGRLRSVYLIISHTYTIHTTGILSS